MKIVGFTGTFGSGKSTAAKMFASFGAYLVDHDEINHGILNKGQKGYDTLIGKYGTDILGVDGEIVRAKLAEVAFSSRSEVRKLESILHPLIIKAEEEMVDRFKRERKYDLIVFDTPLLFETKRNEVCDYTVVIYSTEDKLFRRLKEKFDMDEGLISRRISLQMSLDDKAKRANFVIENNGTLDELQEKMKELFDKIKGGKV